MEELKIMKKRLEDKWGEREKVRSVREIQGERFRANAEGNKGEWERRGEELRETEEEKKAPGSESQCKHTSKHRYKRWDQLRNSAERWGSRRWLGNLTCIFKTHANAPVHLNKRAESKRKEKRK